MFRLITLQDIVRIKSSIEEHRKIHHALKMNDIPLAISRTRENFRAAIRAMEQKSSNYPGLFR